MSTLNITAGGSYSVTESNSTITIATDEAVTLTGNPDTNLTEVVIRTTADNANLTINNLNITNASTAIITVGDGAENKLNITGKNTFEIKSGPGACVNVGGGLTINGTGSFKGTSINAAVIGINGNQYKPNSNITIESGKFDLTCRGGACAIGGAGARGNAIGNITITGTADITASAPAGHASPIGASYWGDCGDILISGDAKVTSTSGQHSAAIGGASLTKVGNITINGNATVNAINASAVDDSAGIGSGLGAKVQSLGDIVIGGNAKVTASSNFGLAIDNIEYHREQQEYGTTDEGDYPVVNENTITIGENATFTGKSGDIYTSTTINGQEVKAANISYNSTSGLTYSGGSELDKDDLEATLLDITSGGTYKIAEGSVGKILINTTEPVTLQGGNYNLEEIQIVGQSNNIDLTINNLRVTNEVVSASVIKFGSGTGNKLTITGDNDFNIKKGFSAGVNIGGGGTISGTGSLKVLTLSGAGIGTDGQEDLSSSNVVIDSGTYDLQTRSGACGIGGAGNGSKIGNITITGTAHVVSKTPQGYAAAIGSAYRGAVGDILINGDATIEATSGLQSAAIGAAVYSDNGSITIGGRASVVANTTSTDVKDAAIGGTFGEQVASIGDIKIIEDATVLASSAHGLAIDNVLYVEGETHLDDYYTVNENSVISISGDPSTANQSRVILTNGDTSDTVVIGNRAYQGGKMVFNDGNLAMTGNWTTLESGGWGYSSIVQMDYTAKIREDKSANFTLSGGNLKDADGDGIPDNVGIGSIIYVQKSGAHTNVRNLGGNVIYNGDALGVEGDDSYNIEAVSPIDLSEEFPLPGYYITDPRVTAMRLISDGATISPRGEAGSGDNPADWYSFDNAGGTVTFRDGSYCLYPESKFFSRSYTKVDISNDNQGVEITAGDDLIQTIGNLADGYEITIESGIAVGERINFETEGNGVIVVKTTANSGKYSLKSDSDEWQYQRYTINGGDSFAMVFGENGSVTGMENFDGFATIEPAGSEIMTINNKLYQGDKIILQNGNLAMTGIWTTLESGGWGYSSVVQMDYTQNIREDKSANFTLSGGNLKDADGDGIPDNVGIGSIIYVQKSGAHTNVRNLGGNVVYNGDALGVEGDDSYNIEAVSPIDLSEEFPLPGYYITDPRVTAMRLISDGATISPRGEAGTGDNPADWYSFDNAGGTVTFRDGSYCLYPESKFFSRSYTKVDISNDNQGVEITAGDDLIQTIGNLADGYEITIESGIAVGERINFETEGNGVIVVKTTANSGKYSLKSDSDEWQYQRYTINGGDSFAMVFGENGSVTGMENFDGTLITDDATLSEGTWVTLASGGFEYTGGATNNPSKMTSFVVKGDAITSTDNLSVEHNLYVAAQGGNRVKLAGLNGNASIDNINLGISNDTNYSAHFTKTADGIRSNVALMEVSDGASINNNYNVGIDDHNAQIKFSDGNHVVFTDTYLPTQDFTTINASNGNDGFALNVDEDKFSTISGLNNGYAISVNAGGNISDNLTIRTDGGKGVVSVQSGDVAKTFEVSGDDEFDIKINAGSSIELANFEGWMTVGDGVYQYVSDSATFTISGAKFDPSVAKVVNNVKFGDSYRIGLVGLNDNVTINGAETGIFNDADYSIHGAISADGDDATITSAFNISDGASVSGAVNGISMDENSQVNFADGNYRVATTPNYSMLQFDTIDVDNGGNGFNLKTGDSKVETVGGLSDGFKVSLTPKINIGDEVTFKSNSAGTIASGNTTLAVDNDDDFTIKLGGTSDIAGVKNFSGTATISGNEDLDRDMQWALQHKKISLDTDEKYSVATLTNGAGDSLKIYYTNDTTGGVIDLSNETLNNVVLLGQGESSTLIGSQGNDQIMGIATTVNLIGNAGNDTFRGGHYSVNIEDYKEDEDSIYLGSTFNMYYPLRLSSISGSDLVFTGRAFNPTLTGGSEMTIKNGADMKIKVFDSKGSSAYVGNYWTIADYDAPTITALENVKVLDASARTTDIQIIGNALDNTIIGGGYNATFVGGAGDDLIMSEAAFNSTMIGGAGNDTFRGGANLDYVLITDYTEGEDVVYHGRPFADLSINGSIEGSDYVFHVGNKTIAVQDGANKVIEVVNVEGERRLFGKYLTLDDNDPATVTAQSGVATIDATRRTKDIEIIGSPDDNTIIGGAGNDTLTGNDGSDVFAYGAGTDIVTDYTEDDKISLGSAVSGTYVKGSNVVFKTDAGSLTIQNARGKTLSLIDAAGETSSTIIGGGSPAQAIKDLTGTDVDNLAKIPVTNAEELSTLKTADTSVLEVSGDQNVDLREFDNPQVVSLGGGRQTVQFNDRDHNVAVVDDNASEYKNIVFGTGKDLGIFNGENANVHVDMANAEDATLVPYAGTTTIHNYDSAKGVAILIPNVSNIPDAVKNNSIQLSDNRIHLDFGGDIKFNYPDKSSTLVDLITSDGSAQKVGFTVRDGGIINTTDTRDNFLLKGDNRSTIAAGAGNDTILAGSRNLIDAGNGQNQIYLANDSKSTVVMSGNGLDTVYGFNSGDEYAGDYVKVDDLSSVKFKFDDAGLSMTAANAALRFDGIGLTTVAGGEKIFLTDDTRAVKAIAAQQGQTIDVDEAADYFFGNHSGLNFSGYNGDIDISLSDGFGKLNGQAAIFQGIDKLQAGRGMATLIGDDESNTLVAGTGYTSVWGGKGNDNLIGQSGSASKDGNTTFFFGAGDGNDTINNFEFTTPENKYSALDDRINTGTSDINNAILSGSDVVIEFDNDSTLRLTDAAGKDFRINNMIAKVDKNITFDGVANCYVADGGTSLTVDSTVTDAEIWLDNSHDAKFFGNILTIDASAAQGNTSLVGNEHDNTIIAGHENSSMWGGMGNDLLVGGDSKNTFFYLLGNGNDTISGTTSNDEIALSDITLDQIAEATVTDDGALLKFTDGGSLTITGSNDVTAVLADGSKFIANHERREWSAK